MAGPGPDWQDLARRYQAGTMSPEQKAAYEELKTRGVVPSLPQSGAPTPRVLPPGFSGPKFPISEQLADAGKAIAPGLEKGAVGALTGLPTMAQMGVALAKNYLPQGVTDKLSPAASYVKNIPSIGPLFDPRFNYSNVQKQVEDKYAAVRQPLYEPHTPLGQAVEGGASTLPAMIAGPGGEANLVNRGLQGAGAVLGGTAGNLAANEFFPNSKVAGPVAQMAGALLGSKVGPRAVTPFPVRDPYYMQQMKDLESKGVKLVPSQRTGSSFLAQREANLGPEAMKGGQTGSSFSSAVMRELGATPEELTMGGVKLTPEMTAALQSGRLTPDVLSAAKSTFQALFRNFYDKSRTFTYPNAMTNDSFKDSIRQIGTDYRKIAGAQANPDVDLMINRIVNGITGKTPNVIGMNGEHYQEFRDLMNDKISGASGSSQQALIKIMDRVNDAFKQGLSDPEKAVWDKLNKQYSNWSLMSKANIPDDYLITPQTIEQAVKSQRGTQAYNLAQGSLAQLGHAGQTVIKPFPDKASTDFPYHLGALATGAAAGRYAPEGLDPVYGFLMGGSGAEVAQRALRRPGVYNAIAPWLGNQGLPAPGMGTAEAMSRALLGTVPQQQQ